MKKFFLILLAFLLIIKSYGQSKNGRKFVLVKSAGTFLYADSLIPSDKLAHVKRGDTLELFQNHGEMSHVFFKGRSWVCLFKRISRVL
jgi:hypothetical protein